MKRRGLAPEGCEVLSAGEPTFPPVIEVHLLRPNYLLMHGAATLVQPDAEHRGVILAIGHPEFASSFYMGLAPDDARKVAGWLNAAADSIDGGEGGQ